MSNNNDTNNRHNSDDNDDDDCVVVSYIPNFDILLKGVYDNLDIYDQLQLLSTQLETLNALWECEWDTDPRSVNEDKAAKFQTQIENIIVEITRMDMHYRDQFLMYIDNANIRFLCHPTEDSGGWIDRTSNHIPKGNLIPSIMASKNPKAAIIAIQALSKTVLFYPEEVNKVTRFSVLSPINMPHQDDSMYKKMVQTIFEFIKIITDHADPDTMKELAKMEVLQHNATVPTMVADFFLSKIRNDHDMFKRFGIQLTAGIMLYFLEYASVLIETPSERAASPTIEPSKKRLRY